MQRRRHTATLVGLLLGHGCCPPRPRDGDGLAQKPYCEATRRQSPTEPRRERRLARGEPQKLPDSRSLLLHGLGELGDRDPEKAAAWGRDGWKRGRRTLQEPCF